MNKRLGLEKETLPRLDNGELVGVVAGTATWTCTARCDVTHGNSCGGVCSGYCPTYTCVPDILTVIPPLPGTIR